MGHTANLHKGQQVTIIVAPLVLISLCCSEIAAQFAMLYRMGHLSPLTQSAVSVGQTNIHGDQSSIVNLVLHFEGNVKLEDNQHELEPGTHLSVGQWNVDCKNNVVGLDSLGHGLIKVSDLAALVGAPWHEPLGALMVGLHSVHTLGGQVMDSSGGARSNQSSDHKRERLE